MDPDVTMLQTMNDFENWKKMDVLEPLPNYKNTDPLDFIKWMRDRENIHRLRTLFIEIFGEVKGESPLKDQRLLRVYYNTL